MILRNGTVYTKEGQYKENMDIYIKGDRIQKIDKNIQVKGEDELDLKGFPIYPGFIDAHSHLGMWEDAIEFEGADGNEATEPITPHLRAIDAINPMDRTFKDAYKAGITATCTGPGSANVIGGQTAIIKTYGVRIDDMIMKAPASMKCALGENPKRVYNDLEKSPMTRMASAALLRGTFMDAKEYLEHKESEDEDKHPDFDMQLEALIPVLKKEIPLKVHAHRADDIFTAIRIAKEFNIDLILNHCTEGHLIADYLKEENMPVIVGPALTDRCKVELKNLTFETAGILQKAGIKIAIMTDHPVTPIQYLPLCAALAAKAGLGEEEALKAITINPAEILGVANKIGSIEVGKDADLVLWDRHPFDLNSKVLMTIINGKIAYRNNEY